MVQSDHHHRGRVAVEPVHIVNLSLRLFKVESTDPGNVDLTEYFRWKVNAKKCLQAYGIGSRLTNMRLRRGPDHRRGENGVTEAVGGHHIIVWDRNAWLVFHIRTGNRRRMPERPRPGVPMYTLDPDPEDPEGWIVDLPDPDRDQILDRDGRAMSLETIAAIRRSNQNRN